MTKSEKSATFVAVGLAVSLVAGVCAAIRWAGSSAVALLVTTAFLTTVMVVLSGWVAYRTWKAHRAAEDASMLLPLAYVQRGIWHLLTRRQWNTLLLGLTSIVALTGTLAGVQVLNHQPSPGAPAATGPTSMPIPVVTTEMPPADTPDPTPTEEPSPSAEPSPPGLSAEPSEGVGDSPAPSATSYLDSVDPVNGSYGAEPVSFSGQRYQRSLTWYCRYPTSSYIEWNVAGYQTFTATLGIADDTSNAFGAIASMTFYDQDGRQLTKPVDVRVGHSQQVRISLAGVVHLRLTCSGRDARTNETRGFNSSLGDPVIFNG